MKKLLYIAAVIWLLATGYQAGVNVCKKECLKKQVDAYEKGYIKCRIK